MRFEIVSSSRVDGVELLLDELPAGISIGRDSVLIEVPDHDRLALAGMLRLAAEALSS